MGDFERAMEIIGPNGTLFDMCVICLVKAVSETKESERRDWWRKCRTVTGWELRRQQEAGRAALAALEKGEG